MKLCKIILIVILCGKTLKDIVNTLINLDSSDYPVEDILSSLIVIIARWGLYYGAGILDV